MSVILRTSRQSDNVRDYHYWFAAGPADNALDATLRLPDLEAKLEASFEATRATWWQLGKQLGGKPTGSIARMPTCGTFGCDFGVMLAWAHITEKLVSEPESIVIICDDPWLFRHLATFPGVVAGTAPPIFKARLKRHVRGFLARAKTAVMQTLNAFRLRGQRKSALKQSPYILVYGHPESTPADHDAYFGNLLKEFKDLARVLHTDCPAALARTLATDQRTVSLHAFGHPLYALLKLPFAMWRPQSRDLAGPFGWLIERAALIENSGGGPAMNIWQQHCQTRFMAQVKPISITWPWENHAWERALCRVAHQQKIKTVGYQHTVVGPHQFNYATASNPDGLLSIPDIVATNGPAYADELRAWGVPDNRLMIAGSLRIPKFEPGLASENGPIFVPLSAKTGAAKAQLAVARQLRAQGIRVLIRPHPMYPLDTEALEHLELADGALSKQRHLSGVLYTTGASGLEAVLMGIPAYRLMQIDDISIDVLPAGLQASPVNTTNAVERITSAWQPVNPVKWESVLSAPKISVWKSLFFDVIDVRPQ